MLSSKESGGEAVQSTPSGGTGGSYGVVRKLEPSQVIISLNADRRRTVNAQVGLVNIANAQGRHFKA